MSYYLMHRGWIDNPIFSDEKFTEREAWLWLIQEASFQPHRIRYQSKMINVGRGQVPTSYRDLAKKWGWGVNRVRKVLDLFENEGMITRKTDTGFLIIDINKYDAYQAISTKMDTHLDTHLDTHSDTHLDTNIKKGNELKKGDPPKGVSPKESQPSEDFDFPGCVQAWNQATGGKVNPRNSTAERKRRLGNALRRVNEHYGLTAEQSWLALCRYIQESDLLAGRSSAWKAEIDWVLKPENLTKILEGNYENRNQPTTNVPAAVAASEARLQRIRTAPNIFGESR